MLIGVAVLIVFSETATRDLFLLFSFVQAVCALAGIFALASALAIPLSDSLRTMIIGLSISYLVVAFEHSLIAFLGEDLLSFLFGIAGVMIVAIALLAMKTVRDDKGL